MREFLFRGKRKDNGEWIIRDNIAKCAYEVDDETKALIGVYSYYLNGVVVDAKTVGQYTGLTDRNGKKIFEGDIVAIEHTRRTTFWTEIPETYKPRRSYDCHWNEKEDELLYKRNYAVEWKAKDARWILRNGSDQHDLRDVFMFFHKGIVIGNIHDNPELLKGGAEE